MSKTTNNPIQTKWEVLPFDFAAGQWLPQTWGKVTDVEISCYISDWVTNAYGIGMVRTYGLIILGIEPNCERGESGLIVRSDLSWSRVLDEIRRLRVALWGRSDSVNFRFTDRRKDCDRIYREIAAILPHHGLQGRGAGK
jgi:hypothetical protein